MTSHYLIPYVYIKGHKDPDFREFGYGESGSRSVRLRTTLTKGSYLFFHTKIGSNKYIMAFFVVEKVLYSKEAQAEQSITCDGRFDDILILGNRTSSKRLHKPVLFNKRLASKLSLNISFTDFDSRKRTELQVIGSATRSHRILTDKDVEILLHAIREYEDNAKIQNPREVQSHLYFYDESEEYIPIDEVHKLRENEIQKLLRKNPSSIEDGAKLIAYEKELPDGDRLDVLLEAMDRSLIVAELKGPHCLSDDIPTQLASYARDIQREYPDRKIRKMIVCDGMVSPKLKKACEDLGIEIVVYGVKLGCFKLS
jgi:hypothetical protein